MEEEPRIGVLGGVLSFITSGAKLVFGVITFPFQLIVNIMSGLASLMRYPMRMRREDHEPLQRRLTHLEQEVGKLNKNLKPLQEIIPKHIDQPVPESASQKLSVLETELANTRKVCSILYLHSITVSIQNIIRFVSCKNVHDL